MMSRFDLGDGARVGVNGLLLKVADETVHDLGRQQVGDEKAVEEDSLCAKDHGLHEPARLAHLHEDEQVHALVEGLLEECLNPSIVALQAS